MPTIPGMIQNCWLMGFNASTQDFAGSQIFIPSYDRGYTWQMRDSMGMMESYPVPDHITVVAETSTMFSHTETTLRFEQDYQDTFGFTITGGGGDAFLRANATNAMTFFDDLFTDVTKVYEVSFFVSVIGRSNVPGDPAPLDPKFAAALQSIATAGLRPDDPLWKPFFDQYGTHYMKSGTFGGYYLIKGTIDKATLKQVSSEDLHRSFDQTFDDFVSQGRLSLDAFQEILQSKTQYAEKIASLQYHRGGEDSDSKDHYVQSCCWAPILLLLDVDGRRPEILEIATLLTGAERAAVSAAIAVYARARPSNAPAFSPPVPFPLRTVLQATEDGFVAGCVTTAGDSLTVMTDATEPPVARRGGASASASVPSGCCTVPVRAGDRYIGESNKFPSDPAAPSVDGTALEIPTLPSPLFGAWKDLTVPGGWHYTGTTDSDGFLVLSMNVPDSTPSQAVCLVNGAQRGKCSVMGGLTDASFCTPVRRGCGYDVTISMPSTGSHSIAWLPLIAGLTLGAEQARNFGDASQATESDGFLLAIVAGHGTLAARMAPSSEDITGQSSSYDRLTLAVDQGFGQSLLLPVLRWQYYGAIPTHTFSTQSLFWIPLTAAARRGRQQGASAMAPNVTITWSATANAQLNEYVHEDDRAAARNAVNARIDAVSADWPLNIEQTDGANYGAGHLLAFKATKTHLEGRPVTVTVNSVFPVHAEKAAGI